MEFGFEPAPNQLV